jgi:hypothetical protein
MTNDQELAELRAEVARLREQNTSLTEALLHAVMAFPGPPVVVQAVDPVPWPPLFPPTPCVPWSQPFYPTTCDASACSTTMRPLDGAYLG